MTKQRVRIGALAALTSLLVTGALAEEIHGITCVRNQTSALVAYEIKYGSGGFRPQHLAAGYEISYAQLRSALKPITIRYDADLRPGKANRVIQTHRLNYREASGKSCALGHAYTFKIDNVTTLLRLYDGY